MRVLKLVVSVFWLSKNVCLISEHLQLHGGGGGGAGGWVEG